MAENDELEARIKAYKEQYGDFVRRLYADDEEAWMEIYKKGVLAPLRIYSRNNCLGKIADDRGLTAGSVWEDLRKVMLDHKKLDLYRYEGDIYRWMRKYIIEIVDNACDRKTIAMNPQDLQNKKDNSNDDSENGPDSPIKDEIPSNAMSDKEKLEIAFARLFKSNPKGATYLLLHKRDGLTAKAICGVLGLPQNEPQIQNVGDAYRKANKAIQKIIEAL